MRGPVPLYDILEHLVIRLKIRNNGCIMVNSREVSEDSLREARRFEMQQKADAIAARIFADHHTPDERHQAIMEMLEPALCARGMGAFLTEDAAEAIRSRTKEACEQETEEGFSAALKQAVAPFIEIKVTHPKDFEDIEAVETMERQGFTPVNKRISYNVGGGQLQLHLAPSFEVKDEIEALYEDALYRVAEVVKGNPDITRIGGSSWLNATKTYSAMKERLGFTIADTSPEVLEEHFQGKDRPVKDAFMSREDFLARYGNK